MVCEQSNTYNPNVKIWKLTFILFYFKFCVCLQLPLVCCFTYYEDKLSQFVTSSILHLYHLWIIICVSVLFLYWALYCLPFFDLRCLKSFLIIYVWSEIDYFKYMNIMSFNLQYHKGIKWKHDLTAIFYINEFERDRYS